MPSAELGFLLLQSGTPNQVLIFLVDFLIFLKLIIAPGVQVLQPQPAVGADRRAAAAADPTTSLAATLAAPSPMQRTPAPGPTQPGCCCAVAAEKLTNRECQYSHS